MRTSIPLLALTMIALAACAPALAACAPDAPSEPPLRLYVLDCGEITLTDFSVLYPGIDEGVAQPMSNSCFLIDHPRGRLIWDAGLADAIGPEGIEALGGAFRMRIRTPMLDQLRAISVAPQSIDFLALSHFHDDHTGNANAFREAALLVQREELEAAFGPDPAAFGFYTTDNYAELDRERAIVLDGRHDVFGDGRVVILPAPGHTPGHQMLLVDLDEYGPVLLAGDLYHVARARVEQLVPGFNYDHEDSVASMEETERFVRENGIELWIQHDATQDATRRHAPEYYE